MAKWKARDPRVLKRKMPRPSGADMLKGPGASNPRRKGAPYARDMEKWGRRVRRDIILLEHYLRQLNAATGNRIIMNLYDDPGDPPPPPNSFT